MSCIIKISKRLCSARGSVLMEFVIVLPIYLALFGALFLIGDMGLKTAALALGDRAVAFDAGDRANYSYSPFSSKQWIKDPDSLDSDLSTSYKTFRTNENFKGSWSWLAAGKVSFAYRLQLWGGKLISYPYLIYGGGGIAANDDLGTLVNDGTVTVYSKDVSNVRVYNYYTLKRTELARGDDAYRNWTPDRLAAQASGIFQHWYKNVYNEGFAHSDPVALEQTTQGADELPEVPDGRGEYKRSAMFMLWSQ